MKLFGKSSLRLTMYLAFLFHANQSQAQQAESGQKSGINHFNGVISATNNGISIIPSFTLGRPAVFFDLSVGGNRLSFDPMFRFGTNGKPWSFVFWWRYKVIKDRKFTLTAGAHPAFIFKEMEVMVDGMPEMMLVAQRFLAAELTPSYKLSPRSDLGIYFLKGHGFNPTPPKNSTFVGLNWSVKDLPISKSLRFKMVPQFYYLKIDKNDGTYVTSTFTLSKLDFPLGLQSTINQKLKSTVAGDDLVWNISLLYTFENQLAKK